MLRKRQCNEFPKTRSMIHLFQMAQLVNNNVIREMRRAHRDFFIEIQIAFARTTSQSRFLIANRDIVVGEFVIVVEVLEATMHKFESDNFESFQFKFRDRLFLDRRLFLHRVNLAENPFGLFEKELLDMSLIHPLRNRDNKTPAGINGEAHAPRTKTRFELVLDRLISKQDRSLHIFPLSTLCFLLSTFSYPSLVSLHSFAARCFLLPYNISIYE